MSAFISIVILLSAIATMAGIAWLDHRSARPKLALAPGALRWLRCAAFLGLVGHRLHLRLDEVRLHSDEALEVPHLHQPFCKLEGARDVALGITEDYMSLSSELPNDRWWERRAVGRDRAVRRCTSTEIRTNESQLLISP